MLSQWVNALESCIGAEDRPFGVWAKANCGKAKVITAETTIASLFCIESAPVFSRPPEGETWPLGTRFRYKLFMVKALRRATIARDDPRVHVHGRDFGRRA
jgi:hypothetical protein